MPPSSDDGIVPPVIEPAGPARKSKSKGGIHLLAGFLLLLITGLLGCGDCPSPFEFAAFGFSFYGLVIAKGWPRRIIGVALSGLAGAVMFRSIIGLWTYR